MKTNTHRKALRAAQSVVSAGQRRAGVLTAAALLGGAGACVSGGGPTGVGAEGSPPEASQADTGASGETTASEVASAEISTAAETITNTPDGDPPQEDTPAPPQETVSTAPETETSETTSVDTGTPELPPTADTSTADATGPQPVEGTCVFSTGKDCGDWVTWSQQPCTNDADCVEEENPVDFACMDGECKMATCEAQGEHCLEGVCHQGQMGENMELVALSDACCFAAYESEEFWIPFGCTPWGPPAPPAWDGRTLLELA